jgi:MFS transporter, ACS family, glucarate transporter
MDATVRPSRARNTVLGFALAAMGVAYLDRVAISSAATVMKADLGLSDTQMGLVFSAFTLAYALFEVPSGWLADRFGARWMLTRIVLWWSAMTAATGAAVGFASLVAVRWLFGMGEAGVLPSLSRAFSRWLPADERGRAFGLTLMAAALGGAATQPIVAELLVRMSWRQAFPIFGAVGVVWAAAWFWWFRDEPSRHRAVNAAELALIRAGEAGHPPDAPHPPVPWRSLGTSRGVVALCAMYFCAIYGWYFYITWLPSYLLRARGFDLIAAGWLASAPLLGIAAGAFVGGWISDPLVRRLGLRAGLRAPGLVGLPLAALCVLAAIATPDGRVATLWFAGAAGCAALGIAPAWSVCLAIGGRHAGVVSGAMNTFGNLGGALSPVVMGVVLDALGSWDLSLYSVAALYAGAALCWLGIDPETPLDAKPT